MTTQAIAGPSTARSQSFLITQKGQLPPVTAETAVSQTTSIVTPEVAAANARRGAAALSRIQVTTARVEDRRYGFCSVMTIAVGAMTTCVLGPTALIGGVLDATGQSPSSMKPGAAAFLMTIAAGSAALWFGTHRLALARAHRALKREAGNDLAETANCVKECTGLERAWLARRAQGAATRITDAGKLGDALFPGLGRRQFGRSLAAIAEHWAVATPEERVQAEILERIQAEVLFRGGSNHIEKVISEIERLTPEARALLPVELKDKVITELAADPGNIWRLERFQQSLVGKRTPYTTRELDLSEDSISLSALRSARRADSSSDDAVVFDDPSAAAERIMSCMMAADKTAQVLVRDADVAETVAACFERHGMRAALYRGEHAVAVTVYEPDAPPIAWDVKALVQMSRIAPTPTSSPS